MQFDVPDPAYTGSHSSRAHFRLALRLAVGFVAALWLIFIASWALDLEPDVSGVRPRQWSGLPGIVFAPLAHGGFDHLVSNTLPLLVLITTLVFLYPRSMLRVVPAVWLGPGIVVWLFGRESVHFGASGLVYGLATFIFVAGVLRRDRRAIAASLAVWFLYGSLIWGVVQAPVPGVSWETHVAAALIGVVSAPWLRRLDLPPRKRYGWESAADSDSDSDSEDTQSTFSPSETGPRESLPHRSSTTDP